MNCFWKDDYIKHKISAIALEGEGERGHVDTTVAVVQPRHGRERWQGGQKKAGNETTKTIKAP